MESLVSSADDDWLRLVEPLAEGAMVAIVVEDGRDGVQEALRGRGAGLELRDTLAVLQRDRVGLTLLFRKPVVSYSSGVAASEALGTGGLNIEACRVGTSGGTTRSEQTAYPKFGDGREDRSRSWARTGHKVLDINAGRWPANVIFVHTAECRHDACDTTCPVHERPELSEYFPQVRPGGIFAWLRELLS